MNLAWSYILIYIVFVLRLSLSLCRLLLHCLWGNRNHFAICNLELLRKLQITTFYAVVRNRARESLRAEPSRAGPGERMTCNSINAMQYNTQWKENHCLASYSRNQLKHFVQNESETIVIDLKSTGHWYPHLMCIALSPSFPSSRELSLQFEYIVISWTARISLN